MARETIGNTEYTRDELLLLCIKTARGTYRKLRDHADDPESFDYYFDLVHGIDYLLSELDSKDCYYYFRYKDGKVVRQDTPGDVLFYRVAGELAMDDCTGCDVTKIVYHGEEYRYCGWQPDMKFEFYSIEDPNKRVTIYRPDLEH